MNNPSFKPRRQGAVAIPGLLLWLVVLATPVPVSAFDLQTVVDKARALAAESYEAPEVIPKFMRELSYDQYQDIRFDPERSLWRESTSRFEVMPIPAGLFYTHPVTINIVDAQGIHALPFRRELFTCDDPDLAKRIPPDLGYAGFKLTYPLQTAEEHNQFLVFAGASYFRAVGRDNAFGLSARGLALDTGLPSGEDFPAFVEYWLVRPSPAAKEIMVYALLDGRSVTGAYAFTITPGPATSVAIKATIFPRTALNLPGIAPLTSMFYCGDNTARPPGEWRRQVHDSDGLLIHDGMSGEWLWRPLLNPRTLQMDAFAVTNMRGFGLLQRDLDFRDYLDTEAQYHLRPSAWVKPQGDWGKGQVVLVQLPSPNETNDNIVAFWTPAEQVAAGEPFTLEYTLQFGNSAIVGEPMGQAIKTLVGDGNRTGGGASAGAYRFIVDFAGGPLDKLSPRAKIVGAVTALENGEVLDHYVEYVPTQRCWRLSMLAKPAADGPLDLRAYLKQDQETLTETWTYRLAADNDMRRQGD
jgi:glucans biosynthesis protein